MELRKTIKRPQRYEEEIAGQHDTSVAIHSVRPARPIPFVDFNPNLPPAAFPTLDSPKVRVPDEPHHTVNSSNEAASSAQPHLVPTPGQVYQGERECAAQNVSERDLEVGVEWHMVESSQPNVQLQSSDFLKWKADYSNRDMDTSDEEHGAENQMTSVR